MSSGTQPLSCCPECGQWLTPPVARDGSHECDPDARIEYHVMRARFELTGIEAELDRYLETPARESCSRSGAISRSATGVPRSKVTAPSPSGIGLEKGLAVTVREALR